MRLTVGSAVILRSDLTQEIVDRYGRLLRYVSHKAVDMDRWQVQHGNASVYVYNSVPFERTPDYRAQPHLAKPQDLGVWTC